MTWLLTASAARLDLVAPAAADIDLAALAEVLARLPRFTGHTPQVHYSVAQHSLLVAELLVRRTDLPQPRAQLYALLHDAHEALVGDMNTMVKRRITLEWPDFPAAWTRILRPIDAAIFTAAGLEPEMPEPIAAAVALADAQALNLEFHDLFPDSAWRETARADLPEPPASIPVIRAWAWPRAAEMFRRRLEALLLLDGWRGAAKRIIQAAPAGTPPASTPPAAAPDTIPEDILAAFKGQPPVTERGR
jgi:hypothetical protein